MKAPKFAALPMIAFVVFSGCGKSNQPAVTSPAVVPPVARGVVLSRPATQPGIIRPGDWVRVDVSELVSAGSKTAWINRVQADQTMVCPLIGPIPVGGLSTTAAVKLIASAYKNANIISSPQISVDRIWLAKPTDPPVGPIRSNDLLRVEVMDLQAIGVQTVIIHRVNSDGTIDIPYVGPVKVTGNTDATAAVAIVEQFRSHQVINNAMVNVLTLESAPANADHLDLPDGPVNPVPEMLKPLFVR